MVVDPVLLLLMVLVEEGAARLPLNGILCGTALGSESPRGISPPFDAPGCCSHLGVMPSSSSTAAARRAEQEDPPLRGDVLEKVQGRNVRHRSQRSRRIWQRRRPSARFYRILVDLRPLAVHLLAPTSDAAVLLPRWCRYRKPLPAWPRAIHPAPPCLKRRDSGKASRFTL